jgi:hypothetical protein
MKLCMTVDLEAVVNSAANETIALAKQREEQTDGLAGFVVAEYNESDRSWYTDLAFKSKHFYDIMQASGPYKKIADFLKLNKSNLRLLPLVYSESSILTDTTKETLWKLAEQGHNTAVVAGFSTELYSVGEDCPWDSVEWVSGVPPHIFFLSAQFYKSYLEAASGNPLPGRPSQTIN